MLSLKKKLIQRLWGYPKTMKRVNIFKAHFHGFIKQLFDSYESGTIDTAWPAWYNHFVKTFLLFALMKSGA